jgi:hypothetical protein
VNSTSTKSAGWKRNCITFLVQGEPFQVLNVALPDEEAFVARFAAIYGVPWEMTKGVVLFKPLPL